MIGVEAWGTLFCLKNFDEFELNYSNDASMLSPSLQITFQIHCPDDSGVANTLEADS